jgi:hypothetical protein
MNFLNHRIEMMIYTIRGHRVMMDNELATLYGVETKRLKEQVKRNIERFPDDFMIIPNPEELAALRSQIATLDNASCDNYVFKYTPSLFTENGVAMLSSVLKSKQAIQVNIAIMRAFTKLRNNVSCGNQIELRIDKLEYDMHETNKILKIVFDKFDLLEKTINPKLPSNRRKIGLNENRKK